MPADHYETALSHYRIAALNDPNTAAAMDGKMRAANTIPTPPPAKGLSPADYSDAKRAYAGDLRRWRERDAEREQIAKIIPKQKG